MASITPVLFEDIFQLREVDMVAKNPKDPTAKVRDKKFDKVSRIAARSESYDTEVSLDVNTEIYPLRPGDKFEMAITTSLRRDGAPDDAAASAAGGAAVDNGEDGLLSKYEYAMYGKIFQYTEEKGKAIVYASFGGLLMSLKGEPRTLRPQSFEVDTRVYLLINKKK